ncbi:hypothetical protein [Streptomyces sp. NPDC005732]|uniref:lipase/acyltransferase domain-containing protein n=1 Tax=Streptomyces sp. NPDC005732 TaxID=3157057 RepID=UPI0033FBB993
MSVMSGIRGNPRLGYRTHDAVVIVPGIMGSVLEESDTPGRRIWGDTTVAKSWFSGSALRRLQLTKEEQEGHYGRVKATKLLDVATWLPLFRGVERYDNLTHAVLGAVADKRAVREFPYDWRLPVEYNAGLLAKDAQAHLERWRASEAHDRAMRLHPTEQEPAKLVLVAHSMGGLLVRHMLLDPVVAALVRACVTLGTPFYGTPKAAALLNSGRLTSRLGIPLLPARRPASAAFGRDADDGLRALVVTLPGIYDLLPTYRCLVEGDTARRLTAKDVVRLGGCPTQAKAWEKRQLPLSDRPLLSDDHQLLVGSAQPTVQSLRVEDGVVEQLFTTPRAKGAAVNEWGDGTVPICSAKVPKVRPAGQPIQSHSNLANADEVVSWVAEVVREGDLSTNKPYLGGDDEKPFGLDTPDGAVLPDEEWPAVVVGGEIPPHSAFCDVEAVGARTAWKQRFRLESRDGELRAPITLDRPGLHRVTFQPPGGGAPISQLVLAIDPRLDD